MIYDTFMLNDEIDLLLVRLREHSFVDKFIIIQAGRTFVGLPKPIYLTATDPRLASYTDRIIWVEAKLQGSAGEMPLDSDQAFKNEDIQRDAFVDAAVFDPDDIVIMSDLDEIIDADAWPTIRGWLDRVNVLSLAMRYRYLSSNLEVKDHTWGAGKAMRASVFLDTALRSRHLRRSHLPVFMTPEWVGWHLSYLLSPEMIARKLKSFSHTELNRLQYTSLRNIQAAKKWRRDLAGMPRSLVIASEDRLPREMMENPFWHSFRDDRRGLIVTVMTKVAHALAWLSHPRFAAGVIRNAVLSKAGLRSIPGADLATIASDLRPANIDEREWSRACLYLKMIRDFTQTATAFRDIVELLRQVVSVCPDNGVVACAGRSMQCLHGIAATAAILRPEIRVRCDWSGWPEAGETATTRVRDSAGFAELRRTIGDGLAEMTFFGGRTSSAWSMASYDGNRDGVIDILMLDVDNAVPETKTWIECARPKHVFGITSAFVVGEPSSANLRAEDRLELSNLYPRCVNVAGSVLHFSF